MHARSILPSDPAFASLFSGAALAWPGAGAGLPLAGSHGAPPAVFTDAQLFAPITEWGVGQGEPPAAAPVAAATGMDRTAAIQHLVAMGFLPPALGQAAARAALSTFVNGPPASVAAPAAAPAKKKASKKRAADAPADAGDAAQANKRVNYKDEEVLYLLRLRLSPAMEKKFQNSVVRRQRSDA